MGYSTGHAGLLWPIFSGIGVPLGKPWVNGKPKSFPLLTGQVYLNDITFGNFNPGQCEGQFDSAVRTNPRGDDMQFPIFAQNTRFINVAEDSKAWMEHSLMMAVVQEQLFLILPMNGREIHQLGWATTECQKLWLQKLMDPRLNMLISYQTRVL